MFPSNKLRKLFNSESALIKEFGRRNADAIKRRMEVLRAAECLNDVSHKKPERRHELTGGLKGKFAVDLIYPFRLVFAPAHEPVPRKEDGGVDLYRVTAVLILYVKDYH